jgi:hypothetical protein
MIEKVRILEKDFPARIPEDIGDKPLEVVNEAGETIALFYSTAFMTEKFDDPVSYCNKYDEIYEIYSLWVRVNVGDCGLSEEERMKVQEEKQKVIDESNLEPWWIDDWSDLTRVGLGRLTYPYHLSNNNQYIDYLGDYFQLDDEFYDLLISYGDNKITSKLMDLLIHTSLYYQPQAEEILHFLVKHNFAAWFEKPELFFTKENIDLCLELALTSKITELAAFLLDYKNKHFPSSLDYTLGLTHDH